MPGASDPRIDRYLSKDKPWRAELQAFRALLLSEGLDETLKWRAPCSVAHDRNIAILGGYKSGARLTFFSGVLLDDPEGRLVAPGAQSRHARYVSAAHVAEIEGMEAPLRALIRAAVALAARGERVPLRAEEDPLPEELAEALAGDPGLSDAWDRLTPGRRRGYVLQIGGAKNAQTRCNRIEKHRDAILDGRGLHDR